MKINNLVCIIILILIAGASSSKINKETRPEEEAKKMVV